MKPNMRNFLAIPCCILAVKWCYLLKKKNVKSVAIENNVAHKIRIQDRASGWLFSNATNIALIAKLNGACIVWVIMLLIAKIFHIVTIKILVLTYEYIICISAIGVYALRACNCKTEKRRRRKKTTHFSFDWNKWDTDEKFAGCK